MLSAMRSSPAGIAPALARAARCQPPSLPRPPAHARAATRHAGSSAGRIGPLSRTLIAQEDRFGSHNYAPLPVVFSRGRPRELVRRRHRHHRRLPLPRRHPLRPPRIPRLPRLRRLPRSRHRHLPPRGGTAGRRAGAAVQPRGDNVRDAAGRGAASGVVEAVCARRGAGGAAGGAGGGRAGGGEVDGRHGGEVQADRHPFCRHLPAPRARRRDWPARTGAGREPLRGAGGRDGRAAVPEGRLGSRWRGRRAVNPVRCRSGFAARSAEARSELPAGTGFCK